MKLLTILLAGFTAAGVTIGLLNAAFASPRMQKYILRADPKRNVDESRLYRAVALNMAVSLALVFTFTFGFHKFLFYENKTPIWKMACEGIAVILIYDFAYYFVHRYLFHEWRILRNVHAIHHAAQYPRAIDSLLLHPVETFIGLALLLGSIASVGGIHLYTFAPIFIGYTALNILNHSGLNIPRFPLKTLGALAIKHEAHHHSMLSGNYASITPLPDIIFGTVEV